jgi:hypothetical protein
MSLLDDRSQPLDSWVGTTSSPGWRSEASTDHKRMSPAQAALPESELPEAPLPVSALSEAPLPVSALSETAPRESTPGTETQGNALPVPPLDVTRLPSRFQADLMRAIFDATRDECVSLVEQARADAASVVETIRRQAAEEAAALQEQAERDHEEAREWLRRETERLNQEYQRRVAERRDALALELEAHASQVERQVEVTQERLAGYEEIMKAFVVRLADAPDPSALVAVAQRIPEPPTPDELLALARPGSAESVVSVGSPVSGGSSVSTVAGAVLIPGEADLEAPPRSDPGLAEQPKPEHQVEEAEPAEGELPTPAGASVDDSWPAPDLRAAALPGWVAGDSGPFGETVVRAGTLEGTGRPPVPAEAAADAGVWIGEPLLARPAADPWAGATWSDVHVSEPPDRRVASEVPPQVVPRSGASVLADIEPAVTTRVSVSGLTSVTGVTSFRRQLARLEGVQAVAVSAVSDGSFEFAVTHHPNTHLDEAVPAIPGFDARVLDAAPDALTVYASDPLRYL